MIGRLRGILVLKKPPLLLIEVGGVGYEVQAPMSTIYQLPSLGSEVILGIYFHVREDTQVLYGFFQEQERALFKALIKISGVGPKMALGILSGMTVAQFVHCVNQRSAVVLLRLPGVCRKTAERLIVEMADKIGRALFVEGGGDAGVDTLATHLDDSATDTVVAEAIAALIALGYKPQDAAKTIQAIHAKSPHTNMHSTHSTEDLIRAALQQLARC